MTKHRRAVFTGEHLTAMEPILPEVCTDFGASLTEFNGEDDHGHLLVEYPPTV
ncbi:IS200/IS605 family transposase [Rhodococcus sp. WMMA185]|uniref:IS200/IS605 family transposase n=1 Tax=Rhodococcus sp. WMMA185 TaxID=679318 RepID=UPI0026BFD6CD